MITTMRSENSSVLEQRSVSSGIDLLERKAVSTPDEKYSTTAAPTENEDEARERMQRNLNRLLNYDRLDEEFGQAEQVVAESEAPVQEVRETTMQQATYVVADAQEEDIRPTSTTMQFGDGEIDNVYNDLTKSREAVKESYKLNGKGKIVVALYALAVTVILALIIINTGVLASIKNSNTSLSATVSELYTARAELTERIETISSDEYVINIAENEYNMVKR